MCLSGTRPCGPYLALSSAAFHTSSSHAGCCCAICSSSRDQRLDQQASPLGLAAQLGSAMSTSHAEGAPSDTHGTAPPNPWFLPSPQTRIPARRFSLGTRSVWTSAFPRAVGECHCHMCQRHPSGQPSRGVAPPYPEHQLQRGLAYCQSPSAAFSLQGCSYFQDCSASIQCP